MEWGGAEVAVVPPPPKAQAESAPAENAPLNERLPEGPVLYHVRMTGSGVPVLTPIAEIAGDTLAHLGGADDWELYGGRFIAAHLRQGTEFTIFRQGVRAGTFVVRDAALPDSNACPRLPRATGVLELVADTSRRASEYLAMPKSSAPDSRDRRAVPVNRGMQIVSPILAERLLRARGAQLPGNWQRAMVQLQPFPLEDYPDPGFATTFLVGDELRPGSTSSTVAYSLFFIGLPKTQLGYDTAYVSFVNYPTAGKSAPRVVDYLDWDRDGEVEILLQTFGTNSAWFEAVGNRGDRWGRIFSEPCRAAAAPAPVADTSQAASGATP